MHGVLPSWVRDACHFGELSNFIDGKVHASKVFPAYVDEKFGGFTAKIAFSRLFAAGSVILGRASEWRQLDCA